MSADNFDALMKIAEDDPALVDKLMRAGGLAQLVRIGQEHGKVFTEQEAKEYLEATPSRELDEDELEFVAGGTLNLKGSRAVEALKYKLKDIYVTSYQL
jgi:predicted ribosomally synthesized peptide with nif11-like leader